MKAVQETLEALAHSFGGGLTGAERWWCGGGGGGGGGGGVVHAPPPKGTGWGRDAKKRGPEVRALVCCGTADTAVQAVVHCWSTELEGRRRSEGGWLGHGWRCTSAHIYRDREGAGARFVCLVCCGAADTPVRCRR
jgi:hypothetical protein